MRNRNALVFLPFLVCLFAPLLAHAQSSIENPGFEQGSPGETPPGWFVPQPVLDAGYTVRIASDNPKAGTQCGVITLSGSQGAGFGNMMQSIDAKPWQGKRVRFRAAVRYERGNAFGQAQLWMRVDREGGVQGFFDNMGARPITSSSWAYYDIVGSIASDAESINIGMLLAGSGRAYIDEASLSLDDGSAPLENGPKALSERGLANLIAFSRLYGYVRFFHPSDGVEKSDWNRVALSGIAVAEAAKDPADLAQRMQSFFQPFAPTVRVYETGHKPSSIAGLTTPSDPSGLQVVTWENLGFGGGINQNGQGPYSSTRVFVDAPGGKAPPGTSPSTPFEADLGGGVSCSVPLVLYAKGGSALPASTPFQVPDSPVNASGDDRTTRLADVAICWNVYEHFYPYFDVVKTDWKAELGPTLELAATDTGARAFLNTLRLMAATAKDGHGYVGHASDASFAVPPVWTAWIEGKLIVTDVGPDVTKLRPGDEILKIDGKTVAELWTKAEPMICGATEQWRRFRGQSSLIAGPPDSTVTFDAIRGTGTPFAVSLQRKGEQSVFENRPKAIEEIKPGIWYVDLDGRRAKMDDYKKAIPDLAKAKGIVFDMRGYPNEVAMDVLQRLSDNPITSAHWNVPKISKPDHKDFDFEQSRWPNMGPLDPRFKGKIAFLTDGRAISYAESVMGIVEAYKLGEIVGGTTAGTNGNVNPVALPGGYTFVFTGMQVIKHDGTTHHGVGIKPTVPVDRTIAGVTAKRDELLEKALSIVGG